MSNIGEIMELAQSYSDSQQHTSEARNIARAELRHLIAAALADAERKGAEAMREMVATPCETKAQIRALPLPTSERQVVLLTDAELLTCRRYSGRPGTASYGLDRAASFRAVETAVLAANNLGVLRG